MLGPNWIAFAVTIYIGGMIWGCLMDKAALHGAAVTSALNAAAAPTGIWNPVTWIDYMNSMFNILVLNFNIFRGDWQFLRWVILGPIILALMYGFVVGIIIPIIGSLLRR